MNEKLEINKLQNDEKVKDNNLIEKYEYEILKCHKIINKKENEYISLKKQNLDNNKILTELRD